MAWFSKSLSGVFEPKRNTGSDANAIQNSLNDAKVNGGTVWLGNYTWNCNSGLVIDPSRVNLQGGGGAVINSTHSGSAITVTQSSPSYKRGPAQCMSGFTLRGNGTGTGLDLYTPTGNDWSTSTSFENLHIENFNNGIFVRDNAYICTFRGVTIGWCQTCLRRNTFVNNGENFTFFGCTLFNSNMAVWWGASNADLRFYGTSFDYNQRVVYTDNLVEFHGCHFEASVNSTQTQFEGDNGGTLKFFGGNISVVHGPNRPSYLFTSWGTGGGYFLFGSCPIDTYYGNQFSVALCNDMTRIKALY